MEAADRAAPDRAAASAVPGSAPPAWVGLWEPLSPLLPRCLIATIAVLVLLAPFTSLPANDLGWQLKAGEIISRTGSIPRVDTLSWTARGEPWHVHEWLVCWVYYQLYSRFGPLSLVVLKLVLLWATFFLVYRLALAFSGDRLLASLATLLAAYAGRIFWDARPQLVTYLLLVLWMLLLHHAAERARRAAAPPSVTPAAAPRGETFGSDGAGEVTPARPGPDSAPSAARAPASLDLWLMPPLTVLWVNCHGGFVVGPLVLLLWLVGTWADGLAAPRGGSGEPWRGPLLRRGWAVLGACLLASLLNPYGYHAWLYPLRLASHPEVMGIITEWFSPSFKNAAYWCYEGLILLTLATLAVGWGRGWGPAAGPGPRSSVADLLLIAAALHLSFTAVRHVAVFGLVAAPLWARHAALALRVLRGRWPEAWASEALRAARALAAAVLLIFLVPSAAAMAVALPEPRFLSGFTLGAAHFPQEALERIRSGGLPGPLWNEYKWGGHLIWTLPEYPVFVDGRAEVYYRTAFDDFIAVHRLYPRWQRVLDERGVNLVLADPGQPISRALDLLPGWYLFHYDSVCRVYARRRPIAGRVPSPSRRAPAGVEAAPSR